MYISNSQSCEIKLFNVWLKWPVINEVVLKSQSCCCHADLLFLIQISVISYAGQQPLLDLSDILVCLNDRPPCTRWVMYILTLFSWMNNTLKNTGLHQTHSFLLWILSNWSFPLTLPDSHCIPLHGSLSVTLSHY